MILIDSLINKILDGVKGGCLREEKGVQLSQTRSPRRTDRRWRLRKTVGVDEISRKNCLRDVKREDKIKNRGYQIKTFQTMQLTESGLRKRDV